MATFTVHVPAGVADPAARADRTVFLRDGFSVRAFLLGPLYLLYHRAWLGTVLWLVAAVILTVLARGFDLPAGAGLALYGVLALLTGLEAGEARRRSLDRRGYIGAGVLAGVSRAAGEKAFFGRDEVRGHAEIRDGGGARREPGPRVIGLFPGPGAGAA